VEAAVNSLGNVESVAYFWPEIIVGVAFLLVLIFDIVTRGARHTGSAVIAIAGLALSIVAAVPLFSAPPTLLFSGMIALDPFAVFIKIFAAAASIVVILFSMGYKELSARFQGEFLATMLATILGAMLFASSTNFVMIYLTLEMLSLPSYILAGFLRGDSRSSEAGIKYAVFGAAASGAMIFGLSFLYGMTGSLDLFTVRDALASRGVPPLALVIPTIFVFAGFAYKISAAPFHMWTPDVYEGASTPITAFFSVVPKAAGFAAMLRFFLSSLSASPSGTVAIGGIDGVAALAGIDWPLLLAVAAVLTMTLGNLASLRQNNVKRLLAYSSIAHAGYMLMGLVLLTDEGVKAVLFYLVVYALMNLGAFLVVIALSTDRPRETVDDFRGLGWRMPATALAMAIFLFSLTGIPPFAGFIGKVYLFKAVIAKEYYWLAVIGVLNSVVSLYYYVRIVKAMYLDAPIADTEYREAPAPAALAPAVAVSRIHSVILVLLAVPSVYFGIRFGLVDAVSELGRSIFLGR
jgi:NADH-quinone oxidoreductase subunit N